MTTVSSPSMNFPNRFYTGVRNTTIVNPAWLHNNFVEDKFGKLRIGSAETFEGLCTDYDFKHQESNYGLLRQVLLANGTDFLYVAAASYQGDRRNHRFVACSADGSLLWNKYVSFVAQGGQNHVYVAGMRINTGVFLRMTAEEQGALLSNSRSRIDRVFGVGKVTKLDESSSLWN